jgi:hypothetical protein
LPRVRPPTILIFETGKKIHIGGDIHNSRPKRLPLFLVVWLKCPIFFSV